MKQDDAICSSSRQRTGVQSRPRKVHPNSRTDKSSTTIDLPPDDGPPDFEALRKARDNIILPAKDRKTKMKYVGETRTRKPAGKEDIHHERNGSGPKRRRKVVDRGRKQGEHKLRLSDGEAGEHQPWYKRHYHEQDAESEGAELEEKGSDAIDGRDAQVTTPTVLLPRPTKRRSETSNERRPSRHNLKQGQIPRRRQSEPIEPVRYIRLKSSAVGRSQTTPILRQSAPTSGPSLERRATIIRSQSGAAPETKLSVPHSKTAPSIAKPHANKGSSILPALFRSSPVTKTGLKKVTCLTCGSDDVPIIKTAKLECEHRMCHACLRRIFTLSVTDPSHMPPKCCTSKHIPLKHVDMLFDHKFKKSWNRKFEEYTTLDRIYCPSRHCGEWIKPNHISLENGRKVGRCKKCRTRVCCICNNKMHTSRDCPKDPDARMFVEVAKKEGWQRCFNCSAMVELKEGCNHMTCRCTAQFCMICGNKWKTCDCPWFNYEAVEADRVDHLNMGRVYNNEGRGAPIRYQQEADRRMLQERQDEDLARRMQMLGVDGDPPGAVMDGHHPGQIFGTANVAEPFRNRDFLRQARNILRGNLPEATRAAEGLLSGAFTGPGNPFPPVPFVLEAPDLDAANQTEQLLRHDRVSNPRLNTAAALRPQARGVGNMASRPTVPLPTVMPNADNAGRTRRASGLGGFFAGGRSQTAEERAADQRIEDWRSDIPIGGIDNGMTVLS